MNEQNRVGEGKRMIERKKVKWGACGKKKKEERESEREIKEENRRKKSNRGKINK
jgi:hypothetical protein